MPSASSVPWSHPASCFLSCTLQDPAVIVDDAAINAALEKTRAAAKDPIAIRAILEAAKVRWVVLLLAIEHVE
jgi:hypothetical protein